MNEHEQNRRNNLEALRALGESPYDMPHTKNIAPLSYAINRCREDARLSPSEEHGNAVAGLPNVSPVTPDTGEEVIIAGRVMLNRPSGGLVFMKIRDRNDDMQIAVSKKRVSLTSWKVTENIDLGDIVVVQGRCCNSRTGEPTVWVETINVVSKAMLTPPAKVEGLRDTETRYRKRYLDLFSNRDVAGVFYKRARIIAEIRRFLTVRDYLEVETPMMHPVLGGAAAKPFTTHHNALDIPLFMRIAPELYLKRLLVGGMERVFEINRNFRNEGISPRHNPEFTMLEAYCAYENFEG
jgi:lysyl-tRNA synthetase class 2